jgi:uncharacterized membrane protein (DUF373 family)
MISFERKLKNLIEYSRYLFIMIMIVYLFICIGKLGFSLYTLALQGDLSSAASLKYVLNDALFVLIVLSFVKTLFMNLGFGYVLTFVEIGFVSILRKLILIDMSPDEVWLIVTLGLISALLFTLILVAYRVKGSQTKVYDLKN